MSIHGEPDPSGNPEFNENEWDDQNLERQVREVEEEREAAKHPEGKPSFWSRLFGGGKKKS